MEHDRGSVDTQAFFEHGPQVALIAGADGRIRRANTAAVRALGRSEEDLRSERIADLAVPEDRTILDRFLSEPSAARNKTMPLFVRVSCKGGAVTWFRFESSRSPDDELIYVVLTEIAQTKEPERDEAWQAFELRLRAFVRAMPLALIELSPIGKVISWNPAAERLFGYTEAEALGRTARELITPPDAYGFTSRDHEVLVREGSLTGIYPNVRKDGSRMMCEWRLVVVRDESGHVFSVAALIRDVTDRVAMERELRHSRDLLRAVLDNAPIVVWEVDADGVFTFVDGSGLRTTKPGELVGKSAFDIFRDNPAVIELIKRGYRGEPVRGVHRVSGRAWQTCYVQLWDAPSDRVKGLICVGFDVTERIEAEDELRQRLDTIEKQRNALRAMSMPIIQVWDDVVALPVVGTMDSQRAADIMETLLRSVSETRAKYAIIDLTGVDTVDTHTAGHLVKVVQGLTLLGARAIVTGIQPNVAHIMVSLGVDVSRVTTVRNLREAIKLCMHEVD